MTSLDNAIRLSSGLVRDLFDHAMQVGLPYKPFALASSLAIVAAFGQRRYRFEGLKDVSLFIVIVGDSADGKSFFQKDFVGKHLRAIDEEYLLKTTASVAAIKLALLRCPSRLVIIDEMAKKWGRVYRPNPCPRQEEILTLLMELYAGLDLLEGQEKGSTSAAIDDVEHPRITAFGGTTTDGMKGMFSNDLFRSDGMASRLLYLPSDGFQKMTGKADYTWTPHAHNIERLTDLIRIDPMKQDVRSPGFRNQRAAATIGYISPEVEASYFRLRDVYEDKADEASKIDRSMSQYYRRGHERALKYAYIHCIGDGRRALTERDLAFGKALLEYEIHVVVNMVNNGKPLLCEEAVMEFLKLHPEVEFAGWQIHKTLCGRRRWTQAEVNASLHALAKAGSIEVIESRGKRGPVAHKYCYFGERSITPCQLEIPPEGLREGNSHETFFN